MIESNDDERTRAYSKVTFSDHARAPVKSRHTQDVTELGQKVSVYLETRHRDGVHFYAPLPDKREVSGATFDDVKAAIRWYIRDAAALAWTPVIHIRRLVFTDARNGSSAGEVRPAAARELLATGEPPPLWVTAGAALSVERFYVAEKRKGDVRKLPWDHGEDDTAPWERIKWSTRYDGPSLQEGSLFSDPTPGFRSGYDNEALIPYAEERWRELSALTDKLRDLHVKVAALFSADDEGRKVVAGRLLDGLPLVPAGPLLPGPTD